MADNEKPQKKSAADSFKEIGDSLATLGRKIKPHLGFSYAVVLLLSITVAVLFVGRTLGNNTTTINVTPANDFSIKFDDATIKKVRDLNSEASASPVITLPDGRINPFSE